ncbi:MAG: hypothetical protein IPO09_20545 [Anaeromyxobacter sp.]|nr:hypothetical protein [Anaeromyxobacter sp.]
MASRKIHPPLGQQEVQETMLALLRIATVWARRSFEDDEPRDRPADERLLRAVRALLHDHQDVPLVNASGSTKVLVRQSSHREYELFNSVHQALEVATADPKEWRRGAARLRLAFRQAGFSLSSKSAKQYFDNLMMERPPTELAGRVLQMAGFRGYSSVKAVERTLERARAIAARREVSRLEIIEYFLACLQVPEEDLHGNADSINAVVRGGTLARTPSHWHRRSPLSSGMIPPWKRPYYIRYAQRRLSDPTRALLGGSDQDDFDPDSDID